MTKISWAEETLNFLTHNCTRVSEGCRHCYAARLAAKNPGNANGGSFFQSPPALRASAFDKVSKVKLGSHVFVNSMSDTFHPAVPLASIQRMFEAFASRPDVAWLLLTKRPQRAAELSGQLEWLPNIWIGTSVEERKWFERVNALLQIPAGGRFLSCEPLLEPLWGLERYIEEWAIHPFEQRVDWVITGGESHPDDNQRRDMHWTWAYHIVQLCRRNNVPVWHKQGSGRHSEMDKELDGRLYQELPDFKVTMPIEQRSMF